MAQTRFSGPVRSDNGFIGGTASDPILVTTAGNISSSYATSSATSGDTRLQYSRLDITSTGSGETMRAFTRVTGANAATGGTVNGAHISLSINGSGTVSGAGNAADHRSCRALSPVMRFGPKPPAEWSCRGIASYAWYLEITGSDIVGQGGACAAASRNGDGPGHRPERAGHLFAGQDHGRSPNLVHGLRGIGWLSISSIR